MLIDVEKEDTREKETSALHGGHGIKRLSREPSCKRRRTMERTSMLAGIFETDDSAIFAHVSAHVSTNFCGAHMVMRHFRPFLNRILLVISTRLFSGYPPGRPCPAPSR